MESSRHYVEIIGRAWAWVLGAVFPRFCAACGRDGAIVCAVCAEKVPLAPVMADGIFSLFSYREPLIRAAIQAHKYHGDASGVMSFLDRVDVQRAIRGVVSDDAIIVPMPLHSLRERARGFNQSKDIAGRIAMHAEASLCGVLVRTTMAEQLAGKSKEERWAVMADKPFAVVPFDAVIQKRVVVIDDVRTTGATMQAALRALRDGGAVSAVGLTFAAADDAS